MWYDKSMDTSVAQIIITAITVCVPASVTLITTRSMKKQANKHSARSDIMQLIIEDHVRYAEGSLPENYQSILDEYDEYIKSGGNSYIKAKVDDYKKWYDEVKNLTKNH